MHERENAYRVPHVWRCNYRGAKTNARNYYIPLPDARAHTPPCPENNQIPSVFMQFLVRDRYKGSSSEENSLLPRMRSLAHSPSLPFSLSPLGQALRIIFTCAHRRSADGRIRALIKLMQPRARTTYPDHAFIYVSSSVRINLSTCARSTRMNVHTWDDFYVAVHTPGTRCRRVPTGSTNCRPLSTSAFLADWFEEKCRANFEVTFSAPPNERGRQAGSFCRVFDVKERDRGRGRRAPVRRACISTKYYQT